jgi:hypothetical protein
MRLDREAVTEFVLYVVGVPAASIIAGWAIGMLLACR